MSTYDDVLATVNTLIAEFQKETSGKKTKASGKRARKLATSISKSMKLFRQVSIQSEKE